ncbi:porin [Roseateles sp.]|uniref:porin n=1 Tax=Roseateles sp. TaxID=1971397 RepID=UPI0039360336
MKKFAFAALVSVVAVPAFAQTVTLWGRFNTTVESVKTGSADRVVKVNSNSSRLGLKGMEDLGGGLKAAFQLEHGFDSDTGNSNLGNQFWGRASNVSLIGNFGEVRLGRWIPGSYFATVDYVSMHNHDTGTSSDALASEATMFNPRSNKVGYFTPKFGNFSAEFDIHAGEGVDARAYDLSVNYDNGPVHYGFGYSKQGTQKQYAIRGLYQLGAFTFGGYYQRETEDTFKANPDRDIGRVSVMYTTGASEFHVNVGGSKAGGSFGAYGGKQYTFGYNYNLSKRTKVYGYYTAVDRTAPNSVGDSSSLAAGLRHNF